MLFMCFLGVALSAERDVKPTGDGLQEAVGFAEQR